MNRQLILLIIMMMLFIQTTGCTRKVEEDNIQREEAMDADDLRETDSYDKSIPLKDEEEFPE